MTPGHASPTPVDSEFVAALLHKISQPLTALRGSLELALEFSTTKEEYRQGIQEAMEQADRMVRLKKVFTELAGHHDLTAGAERAEMSGLLLDAMADSLPVAERLGVRVETSCPVPLHVVVNVPRVTQALSQLLNVALEYSSSQSTVLISCVPSNGHAVTTFSNDRGSIPEMELPRLFDAFFVSRFRPSAEDSSVWLALARKIVEASGGELRAENTPPDGFRLVIRLPLAVTKENGASQISAGAD